LYFAEFRDVEDKMYLFIDLYIYIYIYVVRESKILYIKIVNFIQVSIDLITRPYSKLIIT